jgi:SAM-dependent methyltransferase
VGGLRSEGFSTIPEPLYEPDLLSDGSVLVTLRDRGEFDRFRSQCGARYVYEREISDARRGVETWTSLGYCQPCGRTVELLSDWLVSDGTTINFRERLVCPRCGLNNRQRFVAHAAPQWGRPPFYLYEQVTPFYAWASANLPQVVGSEYLGHQHAAGAVIDGVRHEDALELSFADASLGTIISNDVFEHVPDIDATLAECVRVLRPDGLMIFSIPFYSDRDRIERRAELRDGEVVELLEPQYHGNPVDEKGSLVFYDYGWDILERCRAAGFADAHVVGYWSAFHGYLGGGLQLLFVATRDGSPPPAGCSLPRPDAASTP